MNRNESESWHSCNNGLVIPELYYMIITVWVEAGKLGVSQSQQTRRIELQSTSNSVIK